MRAVGPGEGAGKGPPSRNMRTTGTKLRRIDDEENSTGDRNGSGTDGVKPVDGNSLNDLVFHNLRFRINETKDAMFVRCTYTRIGPDWTEFNAIAGSG